MKQITPIIGLGATATLTGGNYLRISTRQRHVAARGGRREWAAPKFAACGCSDTCQGWRYISKNDSKTCVFTWWVVIKEDQGWFWFDGGSYANESPLAPFERAAAFVSNILHSTLVQTWSGLIVCGVVLGPLFAMEAPPKEPLWTVKTVVGRGARVRRYPSSSNTTRATSSLLAWGAVLATVSIVSTRGSAHTLLLRARGAEESAVVLAYAMGRKWVVFEWSWWTIKVVSRLLSADIISWIQSGFDNFFNDARGDVDHLRNPTIPPRSKARPPTIFIVSVLCICKIWASGQRICTIYPLN